MMKKIWMLTLVLCWAAGAAAQTIFLMSDSSCANYPPREKPMTGWGQVLRQYCKPGIKVDNRAIPGLTARGAIAGGHWKRLVKEVKPGDFVIIQFGHNDRKIANKNGYADYRTLFPQLMTQFINDVRAQGGTPILVSCTIYGYYKNGKNLDGGLRNYAEAMKKCAAENGVGFIDYHAYLAVSLAPMDETERLKYFMCSSGRTDHKGDRCHLTREGAVVFARLFTEIARQTNSPIAQCFVK